MYIVRFFVGVKQKFTKKNVLFVVDREIMACVVISYSYPMLIASSTIWKVVVKNAKSRI